MSAVTGPRLKPKWPNVNIAQIHKTPIQDLSYGEKHKNQWRANLFKTLYQMQANYT